MVTRFRGRQPKPSQFKPTYHVVRREEGIVHCDHLDIDVAGESSTEHQATDTSEAVNSNLNLDHSVDGVPVFKKGEFGCQKKQGLLFVLQIVAPVMKFSEPVIHQYEYRMRIRTSLKHSSE